MPLSLHRPGDTPSFGLPRAVALFPPEVCRGGRAAPSAAPAVWMEDYRADGDGVAPQGRWGVLPREQLAAALAALAVTRAARAEPPLGPVLRDGQGAVLDRLIREIRPAAPCGAPPPPAAPSDRERSEAFLVLRRELVTAGAPSRGLPEPVFLCERHPVPVPLAADVRPLAPPWRVHGDPARLRGFASWLPPRRDLPLAVLVGATAEERVRAVLAEPDSAAPARSPRPHGSALRGEGYWSRITVASTDEPGTWRVSAAVGEPFLMELAPGGDFVLWRGPFEVCATLRDGAPWEGVAALPISARGQAGRPPNGPPVDSALWRHPYVHPHTASVCLGRYVTWVQGTGGEEPPELQLLETLKAACRTLRYGWHARNSNPVYHRPPVVLAECAGRGEAAPYVVVRAADAARFARELGAEIVRFER
jgi:hypothetical protein